jgi:hypothetical protein
VPQYFFLIDGPEGWIDDDVGISLSNERAARRHAKRIIRELKAGGYDDPKFKIIVRSDKEDLIFTMPFSRHEPRRPHAKPSPRRR